MSHSAFLDGGNFTVSVGDHASTTYPNATYDNGIVPGYIHARTIFTQQKSNTIVQTFLFPYRDIDSTSIPTVTRDETSFTNVITMIQFLNQIPTLTLGKNSTL
jgi:hypothetical protein